MKGFYEHVLRSVFHVKPYRCMSCDYRHFRYRPSNTHGGDTLASNTRLPSALASNSHNGNALPSTPK